MFPWVVADIGGTNARFCLVTERHSEAGAYELTQQRDYATADFDTFAACFDRYISSLTGPRPKYACIAVAGPVNSDRVQLTNLDWGFSIEETRQEFALQRLEVINDFQALACSVTHLSPNDCWSVYSGKQDSGGVRRDATKAIIGPGTGLGVAALVRTAHGWTPLPSEGGHRAYSPQTDREIEVFKTLRKKFDYVCAENLLSGSGLVNIYQALAAIEQRDCETLMPSQITDMALTGQDALAQESLDIFCGVLGSVCGDVALTYGAKGGVYLGGGILPRMKEYLLHSDFVARFKAKGVISDYLEDIAVELIVHKNPALIGAAAWLENCGAAVEQ